MDKPGNPVKFSPEMRERAVRMVFEFLVLNLAAKEWKMPPREWIMAKVQLAILFRRKLLDARVIASDETTSRIDGATHWHWVFVSAKAVLHRIAPRRAKAVAEEVVGEHRPAVWVSDRYAGQQDLAPAHQVCLAHVLRDVQYAIDCGDAVFAPRLRPAALGDPHRTTSRCAAGDDAAPLSRPRRAPPRRACHPARGASRRP